MVLISFLRTAWDIFYFLVFTIFIYAQAVFRLIFPSPLKSLNGEIILLTGSAGGIGREICMQLVKSGATLICWDINQRENNLMVKELRSKGLKIYGNSVDVSDRLAVEGAIAKIRREIGSITIIINNAGILPCHTFLSHNPREITRCFEVNVFSQFWVIKECLPDMIGNRNGHIVTICPATALGPSRNLVPYAAASQAIDGLVDSLKYELRFAPKKPDIKFTTVYTGFCQTMLLRNVQELTRFPFWFPIVQPGQVAERLIDGLRRNYEKIYVPRSLSFIASLRTLNPKVQFAAIDFIKYHIEPELEDKMNNSTQ